MRNNNQKIIRRLSARSLKNNRVRNRIAVLAIALTSLLFSGIFTLTSGIAQIAEEQTMREVGTRTHAGLKDVTRKQMDEITQNPAIKSFSWNILLGIAKNVPSRQSELRFASGEEELKNSSIALREGTMPEEPDDLVADTIVLNALGIEPKLGAQVPIEFTFQGEPYRRTFTLCGWYDGDYVSHASELYLSEAFWDELRNGRTDEDFLAYAKAHPEEQQGVGLYNANLWFDSSRGIEGKIRSVIEEAGYEPETEIDYGVNWAYMSSRAENLDLFSVLLCVSALLTVIVTGYLIIHNIFQISILGEIRFYGLLKTLGATGRQIRRLVLREALLLSAAGIPSGLLLGFILCKLLFPFSVNFLDLKGMKASVSFDPWVFVFGALFSLATVCLSCRKPARIASRISPVEAVRYTETGGGKKKQKRSVSGHAVPRMAFANLGRSKGKTCAVVLSMTFSIVLLSIVLTAMRSFRLESYIESRLPGDFLIANSNLTGSPVSPDYSLDEDYVTQVDQQEGITQRNEIWEGYGAPKHVLSESARRTFSDLEQQGLVWFNNEVGNITGEAVERIENGEWGIDLMEYAYTPELLEQIPVLEGSFDLERFLDGGYVLVGNFFGTSHTETPLYHAGETITLGMRTTESEWQEQTDSEGNPIYYDLTNVEEKEYKVMAVVDLPSSLRDGGFTPNSFDLVLPLADMKQQSELGSGQLLAVSYEVEPEKREAFGQFLEQYTKNVNPQMGYYSADTLRAEFSNMIQAVGSLGIILAAIIALVGILNFLNAILTGIQARRREFAMLQSIGLTGRQLLQLLICEGLLYALLSGVLGIILGSLIGYFAVGSLEQMILFFRYRFTALPYLILLPVFLAASVLLPYLACRGLTRTSIVERLRESET